jgi:hypothetical protein
MAWIVVNALITRPAESAATIVLILLGLPAYPLFRRHRTPLTQASVTTSVKVTRDPTP